MDYARVELKNCKNRKQYKWTLNKLRKELDDNNKKFTVGQFVEIYSSKQESDLLWAK